MAQRRTQTDREPGGNVETLDDTANIKDGAEAQVKTTHNGTATIPFDISMAEVTMATRLYELWRTVGQLTDSKYDWSRQSDKNHLAWIAVARACSPPILAKVWDIQTIADLNHG